MSSNEVVLAAIAELQKQVQRIAEALEKQQQRKEYQSSYYKKRKAEKKLALERLKIRDTHCLDSMRDPRMPFEKWTQRLKQFVEEGRSAYNYISWLAWALRPRPHHPKRRLLSGFDRTHQRQAATQQVLRKGPDRARSD